MKTDLFDYNIPNTLIAQYPPEERGGSRLLTADLKNGSITDNYFRQITELISDNSFLVVNNSKVLPARVPALKATGGKTEIFYLNNIDEHSFIALIKGKMKPKDYITVGGNLITLEHQLEDGSWVATSQMKTVELMESYGKTPLPPYVQREAEDKDIQRYQTVYAKEQGSVAAPTAGLHFTPSIIQSLKEKGIEIIELTLHVGVGTFRPIKTDDIDEHLMHKEKYFISAEAANKINSMIDKGKKLVAVGTTSLRTLESAADNEGKIKFGAGETELFIKPGYQFKVVKDLITNFHQPRSSLMVLISALMGLEFAQRCYAHAVEEKYNFFSYGDAMLIKSNGA